MRDFVLDDGFLPSCIDLPEEIREKIVSQLEVFAKSRRDRDLGAERVEGSRRVLSLPVDDDYRIFFCRENGGVTLLCVTDNNSQSILAVSDRRTNQVHQITAPLESLETLLVEGKYLLLAKHLLKIPAATRELQLRIPEIEKIVNAHLPPEARRFHNWWANQKSGKRAHSFAWMAAGWLALKIDIDAKVVTFVRHNAKVEAVR